MTTGSTIFTHPNPAPVPGEQRARLLNSLQFGRTFTDHMVTIEYTGGAWGEGRLEAYRPLQLDPAASVLHYGQAIFEGYKAFVQQDGSIRTFRPEEHAARFNRSAGRLSMPALPVERFVEAGDALIRQDRDWVPGRPGESLYLRPLMIATDPYLGVRASDDYLFLLIASPAGAYFADGVKPVTVWVSEDYVRAAPGGTGDAKCAGNYAASLLAQTQARAEGCDQVVWLDAVDRQHVEEMGGMNLFFVYKDAGRTTIVTPRLTGTLLPGITRSTLLELARDFGYDTEECRITVQQWREDVAAGLITEVFACGTAAVITPVGRVKGRHFDMTIRHGVNGDVTMQLREALLAIQHGSAPDSRGWMHRVCSARGEA